MECCRPSTWISGTSSSGVVEANVPGSPASTQSWNHSKKSARSCWIPNLGLIFVQESEKIHGSNVMGCLFRKSPNWARNIALRET